jgi:hypothetical protein
MQSKKAKSEKELVREPGGEDGERERERERVQWKGRRESGGPAVQWRVGCIAFDTARFRAFQDAVRTFIEKLCFFANSATCQQSFSPQSKGNAVEEG